MRRCGTYACDEEEETKNANMFDNTSIANIII